MLLAAVSIMPWTVHLEKSFSAPFEQRVTDGGGWGGELCIDFLLLLGPEVFLEVIGQKH